jgi:hypothetical protein
MQFNPGLAAVSISATCMQFGTGRDAILIDGLNDADRQFVNDLIRGMPDGAETAAAAALGVPSDRAGLLLESLAPLLVAPGPRDTKPPGFRTERLRADIRAWSAIYRSDAQPVVDRRAASVVAVTGLGRTGSLIAQALAAAGVGTIALYDALPVAPTDVGAGAYRLADIGMRRTQSVRRQLRAAEPGLLVIDFGGKRHATTALPVPADVVVCVDSFAVHPDTAASLAHTGGPHLAVLTQQEASTVGPFVLPGSTACLECLDRFRTESDPSYPDFVAAWHSGRAPAPGAGGADDEAAGAQAAAGLAARQVLLYLDGIIRPAAWSSVLHLRPDGSVASEYLEPHPACGCGLQRAGGPEAA